MPSEQDWWILPSIISEHVISKKIQNICINRVIFVSLHRVDFLTQSL